MLPASWIRSSSSSTTTRRSPPRSTGSRPRDSSWRARPIATLGKPTQARLQGPRAGASGGDGGTGTGNGNGSGSGSGTGSGSGAGSGSGGSGGHGSSGSGAGQGSAAQSTERLYVPAAPLPGQSENDPAPLGPGQDVPLTPYTQVIQAYEQTALDAANQSLIPGSERDLIRPYFSSLGETAG